jgi:hypothetical protein
MRARRCATFCSVDFVWVFYACIPIHHQRTIPAELPNPSEIAIRGLTACELLLISQGYNGVRLRRAARWTIAGEQCNSGQDQGDGDERQRVGGLDAVEQGGQEAGQSQGACNSDAHTNHRQDHASVHDKLNYVAVLRSEGHATADLVFALGNRVGDNDGAAA